MLGSSVVYQHLFEKFERPRIVSSAHDDQSYLFYFLPNTLFDDRIDYIAKRSIEIRRPDLDVRMVQPRVESAQTPSDDPPSSYFARKPWGKH